MTLALIRFVNSLLDPLQKRDKSLSLSVLATTAGLPTAFVEVRHWGTHETNLPGPEVLRNMGIRALEWLWRNYWNKSEEGGDVFQQWKEGHMEIDEVIEFMERREEEGFGKMVVALSEDEDFGVSRKTWDPLLSSLSTTMLAFPEDFLEYIVDTLSTTSNGTIFGGDANLRPVSFKFAKPNNKISIDTPCMDNAPYEPSQWFPIAILTGFCHRRKTMHTPS